MQRIVYGIATHSGITRGSVRSDRQTSTKAERAGGRVAAPSNGQQRYCAPPSLCTIVIFRQQRDLFSFNQFGKCLNSFSERMSGPVGNPSFLFYFLQKQTTSVAFLVGKLTRDRLIEKGRNRRIDARKKRVCVVKRKAQSLAERLECKSSLSKTRKVRQGSISM